MTVEARRADDGDVDAACAVLADAFADYPWTRWTVDPDRHVERIGALQRLAMTRLALPYGEVWVACDDRADVLSVAMWMLPNTTVPDDVLQDLAATTAALEGTRHEASVKAEAHVAPLRPTTPHYYLGAVGTRRDCQRRGYATAVLGPIIDRCDRDGVFACLETSALDNLDFYARLGFVTASDTVVPGGGPRVWVMTRQWNQLGSPGVSRP